jgi:hypothetical protein
VLSAIDDVTRESASAFLDGQANILFLVCATDGGVTLGDPVRDRAHQALVTSPPKTRLALAFAVPRGKQSYELSLDSAASVAVAAQR